MPVIEKVRDDQFMAAWKETGGQPIAVAKALGISERAVYSRRSTIETRYGVQLPSSGQTENKGRGDLPAANYNYNPRVTLDGFEGRMVVFSDCHWWPGLSDTLAYRALLEVIREIKPKLVVANGDILDGAKISRFPPLGWENRPRMSDELEEVKTRMAEIRHAYRGAQHIRTVGNHDTRFDRWLAVNAGEFEGIAGFRLADHLPEWQECMSVFINGHTVVKHRIGNGQHTAYMNTLKAGTSVFTGHTHRLLVTPWGDYNGRRYGCEGGTLAMPSGAQFAYAEDNPTSACSGFATALFDKGGELFHPTLCEVRNGRAVLGNEVVVSERRRAA